MRSAIKKLARSFGYSVSRADNRPEIPEASAAEWSLIEDAAPYTMTSVERRWALIQAVKYVVARGIPGSIVEAGVWRGGSAFVAARTLAAHKADSRDLWLYDTFEGMSAPTELDVVTSTGVSAAPKFSATQTGADSSDWCQASLNDVQATMAASQYPAANIRYVVGKVEDTLADPANVPDQIALLRLDTDWYESTKAEMEILFPRLAPGGVLILDDYGHWQGAQQAVDEYLKAHNLHYLMHRIDYTGRMLIKN